MRFLSNMKHNCLKCGKCNAKGHFHYCYTCQTEIWLKHRNEASRDRFKERCEDMEFEIELAVDELNKPFEHQEKYNEIKKDMNKLRYINYLSRVYK